MCAKGYATSLALQNSFEARCFMMDPLVLALLLFSDLSSQAIDRGVCKRSDFLMTAQFRASLPHSCIPASLQPTEHLFFILQGWGRAHVAICNP